jgi:hypothetical protein
MTPSSMTELEWWRNVRKLVDGLNRPLKTSNFAFTSTEAHKPAPFVATPVCKERL